MGSGMHSWTPASGRDQVVLLPRDPDWAWAYWEVTAAGIEETRRRLGRLGRSPRLALRIYAFPGVDEEELVELVGAAAKAGLAPVPWLRHRHHPTVVVEYPIDDWLGDRLVLLGQEGTPHQAVIGVCGEADAFSALSRSPLVVTPRSLAVEAHWTERLRIYAPADTTSPIRAERVVLSAAASEPEGEPPHSAEDAGALSAAGRLDRTMGELL
jgi:hypothetical protein